MNKLLVLLIILTFTFAEDVILWDLGVRIQSNPIHKSNVIKPLISDTQIMPKYRESTNIKEFNLLNSNLSQNYIIKILYVSERYVELAEYFHHIYKEEKTFNDIDRIIYSDVLYRLGKYEKAINSLEFISEEHPIDEKYFLLSLYNKKLGNIEASSVYLDNLISNYPESEYYKLAKLQFKSFK